MPHGPRRFAKNSENVRHFKLIARSQYDPEGSNSDATPLVLEPFVPNGAAKKKGLDEEELLTIPESLQKLGPEVFGLDTRGGVPEDRSDDAEESDDEERDELADLDDDCYFPKDGYNYNQHLKTLTTNSKKGGVGGVVLEAPMKNLKGEFPDLVLPVKVQPATNQELHTLKYTQPVSNQEEQEAIKALEEAELYEELDDDDLEGLLPGGVMEPELMMWGPAALENEDLPDLALFKEMHAQRIAASRGDVHDEGSEYSEGPHEPSAPISSERFEQLLEDEYGDDEDGALDDDEIEGHITLDNMDAILDEYLDDKQAEKAWTESILNPKEGKLDDVPRVIDETRAIIAKHYEGEQDETDTSEGESEEDESKNWDCESILSTLSNVSNRPGKIGKIKVIKKPAPAKDLGAIVEKESESEEEADTVELPDVVTERPKNETAEEKKQRKAGVKEMRRICRKMKKESKDMYKQEAAKLASTKGSNDVREKLRCVKL
jgi:protein LTV1